VISAAQTARLIATSETSFLEIVNFIFIPNDAPPR